MQPSGAWWLYAFDILFPEVRKTFPKISAEMLRSSLRLSRPVPPPPPLLERSLEPPSPNLLASSRCYPEPEFEFEQGGNRKRKQAKTGIQALSPVHYMASCDKAPSPTTYCHFPLKPTPGARDSRALHPKPAKTYTLHPATCILNPYSPKPLNPYAPTP